MDKIVQYRLHLSLLLLVLGAILSFVLLNSDGTNLDRETVDSEPTESQQDPADQPPPTNDDSDTETVPPASTDEPKKQTTQNVSVVEAPIVFTGFGHSATNPLPSDQDTSTTCTTGASIECRLSFTNQDTGEEVNFNPLTTDETGVARWEWAGKDIGTGTWAVVASAGEKSSDPELIYIQ